MNTTITTTIINPLLIYKPTFDEIWYLKPYLLLGVVSLFVGVMGHALNVLTFLSPLYETPGFPQFLHLDGRQQS
jgi:hypothetical protein